MDDADVDRAVAAARRAYEKVWAPMSGAERGKYLFRIARGIAERARELAVVETLDNGKPIKETRDFDVPTAAQHFFYHAGWADKLQHLGLGADPRPLGVAGQVIPWNFPLLMAAWKIAPALAAGNTVVIKPAETTPLSILVLAEMIADADLPPGVVNIVPGAGDVGSTLVNHPGLDKVAFTGLDRRGSLDPAELAGTGRKITLELGGKGANIVFADAAAGPGGGGHRQRHLLQRRPGLLRRLPAAGAGVDRRGAARPSCGPGWRRCGWATRWTRTPTSVRSTRPASWSGSPR